MIRDFENDIEISYEGTSKTALLRRNQTIAGNKELAIEHLTKAAKCIVQGSGNITPMVIAVVRGKPKVVKLKKDKNGNYVLPTIRNITSNDVKKKRKIVDKLMLKITPILKADIEKVTFVALMRKDEDSLKEALEMLTTAKQKPVLVNRLGCIFVDIGNESFQI